MNRLQQQEREPHLEDSRDSQAIARAEALMAANDFESAVQQLDWLRNAQLDKDTAVRMNLDLAACYQALGNDKASASALRTAKVRAGKDEQLRLAVNVIRAMLWAVSAKKWQKFRALLDLTFLIHRLRRFDTFACRTLLQETVQRRAILAYELKLDRLALQLLPEAVTLNADAGEVRIYLGICLFKYGRRSEAIAQLQAGLNGALPELLAANAHFHLALA